MSDIERVSPGKVRENVQAGNSLLVCAYDDDGKYERMHLDQAIALSTFKSDISGIPKDREIIFY